MAPVRAREPSIERTPEYEEFIEKLAAYHEKRGTHLDREPKVGNRHIDLLKLYKRVVDEGGYDKVSDTKTNKLAWRKLAGEFLPGSNNLTTQAFIVKSAYYKNLAAYEITHVHNREPPPKEILEDVTAKGGDLLSRTVENYFRPVSREADRLGHGDGSGDSDSENDTSKTPKESKMDTEEPGSTGRVTRTLRHAPPQRVLFQPDVSAPRQTRQSTGAMNSPQPGSSSSALGTNDAAMTIANYQPATAVPSSMKPVVTPATNPDYFRNLRNRYILSKHSRGQPYKGMMLPGTGYPGPNIYIRALHSLQSGVPEEEAYALHHMVKISHERGDKYRFDQFPGLAEALMNKVIQVASLFYDVSWDVSYVDEVIDQGGNVLNGLSGTKDLQQRIQSLEQLDIQDELIPQDVSQTLGLVNEAGLVLRNMVMLHENAAYLSTIPLIRDVIVIILNLPRRAVVVELQHYALEIAEQLTRFWTFESQDPVYRSLLEQTDTEDRGRIVTSLKALGRTAMHIEAPVKLEDVPVRILHSISDWLLIEDEELRSACLDFLYLYTRSLDNVKILVQEVNIEALVNETARLLMYNALPWEERRAQPKPPKSSLFAETPPKLSSFIIDQLVTLDEPERSSQWLRTCFEEDINGEITQIALWSAYNSAFQDVMTGQQQYKSLMPAKDFITNVSTTFTGAQAQVSPPAPGATSRYTIKGIRPRAVAVDPATKKAYMRCHWQQSPSLVNGHADLKHSSARRDCGEFAPNPKAMWEHVVSVHLKIPRDESGKWILEEKPDITMTNGDVASSPAPKKYLCQWGGCKHFHPSGSENAFEVGQHIKTHLPDTSPLHSIHAKHNRTPSTSVYTPNSTSAPRSPEQPKPRFIGPVGFGALGMGNGHSSMDRSNGFNVPTPAPNKGPQPPQASIKWITTPQDDAQDACGLPLGASLVLRNLARMLPKLDPPTHLKPSSSSSVPTSPTTSKRRHDDEVADAEGRHGAHAASKKPRMGNGDEVLDGEVGEQGDVGYWIRKAFFPVKEYLFYVMAHNFTVKEYLAPVLSAVVGVGVGGRVEGVGGGGLGDVVF